MEDRKMKARIVSNPAICSGKPCIAGTRLMVKNILGMVAGGYDIERILEAYPDLKKADVVAALEFAQIAVDKEAVLQSA